MNTKNKIITAVVVVALAGGALFAYNKFSAGNSGVSDAEMELSRTFTLGKGDLQSTIDVSGVVVSAVETEVTTDLSAKVVKLNVKQGDKVKKGDIICELDSTEIDRQIANFGKGSGGSGNGSAIKSAQKALERAKEARDTTKEKQDKLVDVAQRVFNSIDEEIKGKKYDNQIEKKIEEKEKTLYDREDSYIEAYDKWDVDRTAENEKLRNDAKDKLDEAQTDLDDYKKASRYEEYTADMKEKEEAQKSLDDAKEARDDANKQADQAVQDAEDALKEAKNSGGGSSADMSELEKLKDQKEACTLRAESTGEITSLNVKLGSIAKGSVALIQSTDKLIFEVSIPEESINKVQTGLKVMVNASSIDVPVTGTLTQISSTTGSTSVSSDGSSTTTTAGDGYKAQITLDEAGGLHIGSKAQGSIILSSKSDVFIVPIDAIGDDEGLSYIRVVQENGSYKKVAIEVGERNDTMAEIIGKDLVEGMEVLADAYYEDLIKSAKEED